MRISRNKVMSSLGVFALAVTLYGGGQAAYASSTFNAEDDPAAVEQTAAGDAAAEQAAADAEAQAAADAAAKEAADAAAAQAAADAAAEQAAADAEADATTEETPVVTEEDSSEQAPQSLVANKPDGDRALICTDITAGLGYEDKVDTTGDPATVEYTAPDGFLVDAYCVKAGTEPIIIQVNPPSATVIIDHPNKDSVSHYQVHLVPAPEDPKCIDDPVFSYTFDPATGSGDVTVTGGEEGEELCEPLYVRAASWDYDLPASGAPSWSQTKHGFNDTLVDAIGTFHYGPPQIDKCRQYDAYASFDGWAALALPDQLFGSHDPYEPAFLHETLPGSGPNPTWSYTSSEGCNEEEPTEVEPASPTKVDVCGIANDTFTLPGAQPNELVSVTAEGTYTADDLPNEDGTVAVTFVPADGTVVKDDPNAEYEVDKDGNAVWILVFTDEPCPVAVKPAVQHVVICGVDNDTVTTAGTPVENAEGITETEEFYYVIDPDGTDTPGTINVLAIPKDGVTVAEPGDGDTYVIDEDGNASWTFVDDDAACPSTTTPGGTLALTGNDIAKIVIGVLAALVMLGIGIPAVIRGYRSKRAGLSVAPIAEA